MVRLISRQHGGLAALKLTKLFGIDDFPAAKDSGRVLIIIIYCYLIIKHHGNKAISVKFKLLDMYICFSRVIVTLSYVRAWDIALHHVHFCIRISFQSGVLF